MAHPHQRIGEYVLVRPIGSGGFGEVWLAHHHSWTERHVAVKIPTDPGIVRALQREGALVHRLAHPNIVQAINFDSYSDPPYLVSEFVPGTSLRQWMMNAPLRIDDAVAVMCQVLHALAF